MSLKIIVRITDMKTGDVTSKLIDYDDASDRHWLGKKSSWALHNGHKVETWPFELPKTES